MQKMRVRLVGEYLAVRHVVESTYYTVVDFLKSMSGEPGFWWDLRPFMRCTECKEEWIPKSKVTRNGCQLCEKCRLQVVLDSFRKKEKSIT